MKNKIWKKLSLILLIVMLLSSNLTAYSADISVQAAAAQQAAVSAGETASQIESRFPEEQPTDRLYAQSRRLFKAYKGRGSIIIENHGAEEASVFVNGVSIPIGEALKEKNGAAVIDIGGYTVDGDNTLKVLNIKPEGQYISIKVPYPELISGKPGETGFSDEKLAAVDAFINSEVEAGFPGAVLLIMKDGKIIKNTAYGYKLKYHDGKLLDKFEAMDADTMFDQASNTKMFATNIAIQKLVSEGKIDVNELVCKYIPGFTGETREKIKVKDLLTHSAGFASSIRFYLPDNDCGEEFYSHDRSKTLKLLEKAPLEYPTGTKTIYSDTDYMLLGYIIENVTGLRLDQYIENNIYKPLGLQNTVFTPMEKGFDKDACAATEILGNTRGGERDFPDIRKYTLQGEVHDEKTYYSMGGVSGHAGLFSTTSDMAILCQLLLNQGGYGDIKIFDKNVWDQFTKPSDNDITFGLGWNRAGNGDKIWQFGPYAGNTVVGHTGWTGTLTVIDPENDMAIVLLTNKKHSAGVGDSFEGDKFETGKYGSIVSLIYEALLERP